MTDTATEATEAAQEPQEPAVGDTETTAEPEDADNGKLSREAAGYRRQLRETETERDQLTERVTELRTHIAETVIGEHMKDPSALWRFGVTLDDVCDPGTGLPDAERIRTAAGEAQDATKGVPRSPKPDPNMGQMPSEASGHGDVMADALRRG